MSRLFASASSQYGSNSSAPVTAAPLTIAGWWKPTTTSTAAQAFLSLGNSGTSANVIELYWSNGQLLMLANQAGSTVQANATMSISAGTWYHVAGVERGTSRDAYANGTIGTIESTSKTPASINSVYLAAQRYNGSTSLFCNGAQAEFGLWNVELTQAEITALSKGASPLSIRPASLVGYWPLVGKASPEIDPKGGRSLTLSGSPTADSSHPRIFLPRAPHLGMDTTAAAAALAANAAAQATATAALTTQIPLAATAAAQSTATAALSTSIPLASAPGAQATATAALTTQIPLAASAAAVATATADLTAPGSGLAAAAVASATATASLSTSIRLAAAAAAVATATADLTAPGAVWAANAVAQCVASANLTTAIRLAAQAIAQASATAALTATGAAPVLGSARGRARALGQVRSNRQTATRQPSR